MTAGGSFLERVDPRPQSMSCWILCGPLRVGVWILDPLGVRIIGPIRKLKSNDPSPDEAVRVTSRLN
jgi:hypothetical protein